MRARRRGAATWCCAFLLTAACASEGDARGPVQAPLSYRIVYEITEADGTARLEERIVRRPYEALSRTVINGQATSARVTNSEGLWLFSPPPREGWTLVQPGPQRAAPDPRPLDVAGSAQGTDLLLRVGDATHLGRPCAVLRTGADPAEPLRPPGEADHVELCVDSSGAVLRQTQVAGGKPGRRMVATEFDLEPQIDEATFAAEPRLPDPFRRTGKGYGTASDPRRERLEVTLDPPAGFAYDGWSGKLALAAGFGTPGGYSVIERFVRGGELLELDHSAASPRGAEGTPVEIEGLPRARLIVDLTAARLILPLPGGRIVELRAASPDLVLRAAAGLDLS